MTIHELHRSGSILLEAISGSKAYGTDHPDSDTDIRGIFMAPQHALYGLRTLDQVNDKTNDIVFYELGRFFELALKNNPTVMELLYMPGETILQRHPIMDMLRPELFLSKRCLQTFGGYANAQVSKAFGLNKKIMNPMDKERKGVLDFCYVMEGQGAVPLLKWLAARGLKQEDCGLVNVPHMHDVYALFHPEGEDLAVPGFKGIAPKPTANNVSLSSVPKGMEPLGYMSFNLDGYQRYCKDYKNYWEWVEKRNEARYNQNAAHGKNYDSKNMMHTFRLLDMAEEIAREGKINVRRPNREELLRIRSGAFSYEELRDAAREKLAGLDALYAASALPDEPDEDAINQLLVDMR